MRDVQDSFMGSKSAEDLLEKQSVKREAPPIPHSNIS